MSHPIASNHATRAALITVALVLASCADAGKPRPPAPPAASAPPAAPAAPPAVTDGRLAPKPPEDRTAGQECARDEDCRLVPTFHCCGGCEPAPPFRAMNHGSVAAAEAAENAHCATEDHDCSRHRCAPVPTGCSARAICHEGSCRALVSDGCPDR